MTGMALGQRAWHGDGDTVRLWLMGATMPRRAGTQGRWGWQGGAMVHSALGARCRVGRGEAERTAVCGAVGVWRRRGEAGASGATGRMVARTPVTWWWGGVAGDKVPVVAWWGRWVR
ncbi:hypothetical protein GUJ93_ZPchr0001g32662 [Zizania palustris]|uniref:Uncharacterized protein n=1 Tax=Zizania palustris TaxID=103762 RepID=A0A8J5RZP7_ZIZPA|nr:hypothetical protein GUJ93_ZPchr0001g32662 [Zizania palustris]